MRLLGIVLNWWVDWGVAYHGGGGLSTRLRRQNSRWGQYRKFACACGPTWISCRLNPLSYPCRMQGRQACLSNFCFAL